jgi:hypothetical protein
VQVEPSRTSSLPGKGIRALRRRLKQDLQRSRRPFGVTLIAIVQAVNALTLAFHLAVADRDPDLPVEVSGDPGFLTGFFIVFGLAIAVGLWRLQRWAWVTTMLWAGAAMATGLWSYWENEPVSYPVLALTLVQVFYLNLSEVQDAFGARHSEQVAS